MSNSDDQTMGRLDRVEAAFVHITDVLVLHGDRLDSMSLRLDSMNHRLDSMNQEMRAMHATLADRLDRLIAVTMKERTMSVERLATIEERLARIERHVGI